MISPDPSTPFVIHSCPDCEAQRREREPWMHELVLEGDRLNDFFRWAYEAKVESWEAELRRTFMQKWPERAASGETKTIIRSPDKEMLALAKMFLD